MRQIAILVVDANQGRAARLASALGYGAAHVAVATSGETAELAMRLRYIELVVIRSTCEPADDSLSLEAARDITMRVRRMASESDLLVVGLTERRTDAGPGALDPEGFDYVLSADIAPQQLRSRIEIILRLLTMQRELRRRLIVAEAFHFSSEAAFPAFDLCLARRHLDAAPKILHVDLSGEDRSLFAAYLANVGEVTCVRQVANGEALQAASAADLCVVDAGAQSNAAVAFILALRNSTTLFNLPAVLVAPQLPRPALDRLYRAGATDVVICDAATVNIEQQIRSLLRIEQLRRELVDAFETSPGAVVTDSLTGAHTHGFGLAYLDHALKENAQRGWPLVCASVRLIELAQINANYGFAAGDAVLKCLGDLLRRLVRAEDFVARIGGATFLTVFPDVELSGGQTALDRLRSVLSSRSFSLGESGLRVNLRTESTLATGTDAQSAVELVERLRHDRRLAA